jgi:hypothetical protein
VGKKKGRTMNPLIQLKQTTSLFLVAFGLASFGISQALQAVSPPPDGCYSNFTTAEGCNALQSLTTGLANTGIGWYALFDNTVGSYNTAVGAGALDLNTADNNTAVGAAALLLNTTGNDNTATGTDALALNTTGAANTASGNFALFSNTTGGGNTGVGSSALQSNTTGNASTAVGSQALLSNSTGSGNTAIGSSALQSNTTGESNTAIGASALLTNTTGGQNTAIGPLAGANATTGSGNVYIGVVSGVAGESLHTYIANINTTSVSGGGTDTVTVNLSTGLLGHLSSSRRYKEEIKPMNNASEALFALKPVTYRYKKEIDHTQSPAFGLIAEEVAEVNPALVARNSEGQPESVHYEMVNAMLLNEFLKEHCKVEQMQKQIDALTAGLQEVSAQLQLSKSAPQTVLNDQ